MADQCVTRPTLTRSESQVQQSVVEIQITNEVTLAPTTSTTILSAVACITRANSTICTTSFTTSVTEIPGGTSEVVLTTLSSTPVTNWVTETLFATSCPDGSPPTSRPDTSTSASSTPPPYSSTESSGTSGTSSATSSNTSSATSTSSTTDGVASSTVTVEKAVAVGPIVGGAIGGFVGLAAIVLLTWYFLKKANAKRFDGVFDKEDLKPAGLEKPPAHHYNLVSQQSPPPPPPANLGGQYQDTGYQGGNYQDSAYHGGNVQDAAYHGGNVQDVGYQGGNYNETAYQPNAGGVDQFANGHQYPPNHTLPVLSTLGGAAAGAAVGVGAVQYLGGSSRPSTNGDRPSTGSSTQPLLPQQGYAQQYPQQQPYGQQQGYPTQQSQQGQRPQSQYNNTPATGYPPQGQLSSQGYGYPPASILSHTTGTGSISSAGGTSSAYSSYPQGVHPPGMVAALGGAAAASARHERDGSTSSVGRSGSPVSIQNHGVLQVMNPEASFGNYGEGSSSGGGGSRPSAPAYDGKGRPVNLQGEKAPIIHLDGGRYEEPVVQAAPASTSQAPAEIPPAYSPS